jgi:trimeric autotransporter adhesin
MKKTLYKLFAGCLFSVAVATSAEAQTINTFCGTGVSGYSGDGGSATAAQIWQPSGIRIHNGDIYFSEAGNNIVRKVAGTTNIISKIAGTGSSGYSGDGGAATAATLGISQGDILFDNSGNMYISEVVNHTIRRVNTSGIINTIAGDGGSGSTGDGGAATAAKFNSPFGLAFDASGNLYVADDANHKIRKIDMTTGIVTTIVGNGVAGSTGDGGLATAAQIEYPVGLAIDASNILYFSEFSTGKIRKVNLTTGIINTHATGMERLYYITFDQAGNIFAGNDGLSIGRVYKISPSGTVTTVAGGSVSGSSGDGGPATAAGVGKPHGVAVTSNGSLLISDYENNKIRIVSSAAATITGTPTTCVGSTTAFAASIPNAAWISGNAGVATVSATGVVTGVAVGTATITYVAGLVFGTRVVTVNAPVAPVVSASGTTLSVAGSFATYQWSLGGAPIAGATGATYVATAAGTYVVAVTTTDGCSATSADFVLSSVSVSDVSKGNGLQVFPNPATDGRFAISVAGAQHETITIVITNAVGAKVFESKIAANKMTALKLDVPTGVYMLQAATAEGNYHSKIMVK